MPVLTRLFRCHPAENQVYVQGMSGKVLHVGIYYTYYIMSLSLNSENIFIFIMKDVCTYIVY